MNDKDINDNPSFVSVRYNPSSNVDSSCCATDNSGCGLSSPWANQDDSNPTLAGSASYVKGTFDNVSLTSTNSTEETDYFRCDPYSYKCKYLS